ncbi:unnamed protein product [Mytilus edulis]|uniref:B box-type domain-containing protein n=1 Tax=Mytilus edulis TaxID=6550 RepID=A0A8S3S3F2_MYTED|nr:unnamed protein product [Mytilus edulis]
MYNLFKAIAYIHPGCIGYGAGVVKKCKLCGNENGHFFCYDCKHVLCQECRLKHDRIPALKTHTITASDVIDRSAYTSKSECTLHDQECSLYCSTCKTLTCTQCVTSSHKNHSFVDISAVASEARKSAENYIAKIKEKISNLSDMITKVKSCHMKKLGEEAEQVLFKIDCSSQDIQKIIDSQTDISKINVEDWQNLEKADVEVHLQGLEQMYKVHTKLCDELENMLREKHDKTFFLHFKNLKADCENLEEIPEEIDFKHIEEFDTNAFVHHVTAMIVKKFSMSDYGRTDELQDQIKDQKLELLALHERTEQKIKTIEAENTTLKRQLQQSHARIETLEKEKSDSKENIEHSEKRMKAVTEENKMLKHELEMSETRIKTVEEKNAIVKEKLER